MPTVIWGGEAGGKEGRMLVCFTLAYQISVKNLELELNNQIIHLLRLQTFGQKQEKLIKNPILKNNSI